MVRIIGFKERQNEDGTPFFILELQGGIEMVKSQATSQFYATAKKAFVTSTFDGDTCRALVGTEMGGSVAKQEVEPYTYVVKETGEELILYHRYVYVPENEQKSKNDQLIDQLLYEAPAFSRNGVSELAEQAI